MSSSNAANDLIYISDKTGGKLNSEKPFSPSVISPDIFGTPFCTIKFNTAKPNFDCCFD
jgi:hypothetical protein